MKRRTWTPADEARLRAAYPDTPTKALADELGRSLKQVYTKAKQMGLKKTCAYMASAFSGRRRPGQQSATQFRKGNTPWNAGLKGIHLSPSTEFRPGEVRGTALANLKPLGHRRITDEGYHQEKIREDGPPHRRWAMVHVMVWQAENGPVPDGHIITFLNGDKNDLRLENLACIHRRDNMARNSRHAMPAEINELIYLRGRLTRQINKRTDKKGKDK